jgi:phage baseplate assembly protein W
MMDKPTAHDAFGHSFVLDDGDFVLQEGDLALVSGTDNLLQALNVMIYTGFGTDVFNVNYGLDAKSVFTTAQTTRAAKELIRLNLVKSISQDDRVTLIKEVVFDDDPRYYELLSAENAALNEQTRRSTRQWQALVVLQTIAAGEVALRLEGTGLNP